MTRRNSSLPSIMAKSMAAAGLRRLLSSAASDSRDTDVTSSLRGACACSVPGCSGGSSNSLRTWSGVIPEARPTSAASCHPLSRAARSSTASSLVRVSAVSTRLASSPRDSTSARSAVMTGEDFRTGMAGSCGVAALTFRLGASVDGSARLISGIPLRGLMASSIRGATL